MCAKITKWHDSDVVTVLHGTLRALLSGTLEARAWIDVLQGLFFALLRLISYSSSAIVTVSSCVHAVSIKIKGLILT